MSSKGRWELQRWRTEGGRGRERGKEGGGEDSVKGERGGREEEREGGGERFSKKREGREREMQYQYQCIDSKKTNNPHRFSKLPHMQLLNTIP